MPYLTLTENLKLQLSPGLVASYDILGKNGGHVPHSSSVATSLLHHVNIGLLYIRNGL